MRPEALRVEQEAKANAEREAREAAELETIGARLGSITSSIWPSRARTALFLFLQNSFKYGRSKQAETAAMQHPCAPTKFYHQRHQRTETPWHFCWGSR